MSIKLKQYKCLKRNTYELKPYSIVPIRYSDMEFIRKWRNRQIDILRQNTLLTKRDQKEYYTNIVEPLFSEKEPSQILFSYLQERILIGYGGLTNIDWLAKRAEVSFLLDDQRVVNDTVYWDDFSNFLALIKKVAFYDIYLHRLYTETYDIRPLHVKVLKKNGFKLEGTLKDHVVINNNYIDSLIHGLINV